MENGEGDQSKDDDITPDRDEVVQEGDELPEDEDAMKEIVDRIAKKLEVETCNGDIES